MEKLANNKPKVDDDLDEGSEEQAIDNATATDAKKKKKKNKKNKTKQPTESTPTDAGTQVMALETPKTQPLAGETADRLTVKTTEATGADGQADAEKKKKKKKSRLLCDPREEENCRRRCRKRQ